MIYWTIAGSVILGVVFLGLFIGMVVPRKPQNEFEEFERRWMARGLDRCNKTKTNA